MHQVPLQEMAEKIAVPGGTGAGADRLAVLALAAGRAPVIPDVSSAITASRAAIAGRNAGNERIAIIRAAVRSQGRARRPIQARHRS